MKPAALVGLILIIVGIASLTYVGFTVKSDKKIVDIGPIEIHKEKKHWVSIPPVIGGVALVGGIVLVLSSKRE